MLSWFKGLFKKPPKPPPRRVVVIFDGDQPGTHFTKLFNKEIAHVEYFWVQNKRASTPKSVKKSGVKIIRPSDLGKESVDTFIAMKVVDVCKGVPPPNHVYIVSRDGDFIDVVHNAAVWFKNVKFTLMIQRQGNRNTKKAIGCKLPSNASLLFFTCQE